MSSRTVCATWQDPAFKRIVYLFTVKFFKEIQLVLKPQAYSLEIRKVWQAPRGICLFYEVLGVNNRDEFP